MAKKPYEYGGQYRPEGNTQGMSLKKQTSILPNNQRNWMSEHFKIRKPFLIAGGTVASISTGVASYTMGHARGLERGANQILKSLKGDMKVVENIIKNNRPPQPRSWASQSHIQKGLIQAEQFANKSTRAPRTGPPGMTNPLAQGRAGNLAWYGKETVGKAIRNYRIPASTVSGVGSGLAIGAVFAGIKGYKRAVSEPTATWEGGRAFHTGKPGKHYLDLSVNKTGKYGVDY